MNDFLRKECKLLKAMQGIAYSEIAEYLGLKPSSFYNWLCNYYDFGEKKQKQLKDIINDLKE